MNSNENRSILVVDDESELLMDYVYALSQEGYRVSFATSESAALESFEGREFDLVVLDYTLNGKETIGLADDIRRGHRRRNILVISYDQRPSLAVEYMKVGARNFVPKPFDADGIVPIVKKYFNEAEETLL
jgi:DNA-binding NtrC family response regulator